MDENSQTIKITAGSRITLGYKGVLENGVKISKFEIQVGSSDPVTINTSDTLIIEGDATNALMSIAGNIGVNPKDAIPHIAISTNKPLAIEGGSFIVAKESKQAASVSATPVGLFHIKVDKSKGPDISWDTQFTDNTKKKDARLPERSQILSFDPPGSGDSSRMVVIEESDKAGGNARIQFVNPHNRSIIVTLSGKERFTPNSEMLEKKRADIVDSVISAISAKNKTIRERLEKELGLVEPPRINQAPKKVEQNKSGNALTQEEYDNASKSIAVATKKITDLAKSNKTFFDNHKSEVEKITDNSSAILAGGKLNQSKLDNYMSGLNGLIDAASTAAKTGSMEERQNASMLLGDLKRVKTDLANNAKGIKISQAPGILPDHLVAAVQEAVDPNLKGRLTVASSDHNAIAAPATQTLPGQFRNI